MAGITRTAVRMNGERNAVAADPFLEFFTDDCSSGTVNRRHLCVFAKGILDHKNIYVPFRGTREGSFNVSFHNLKRPRRTGPWKQGRTRSNRW